MDTPTLEHIDEEMRAMKVEQGEPTEKMVEAVAMRMCELAGDDPHQLIWEGNPPEPWGEVWNKAEPDARELCKAMLAAAPSQEAPRSEWIAVSERLPDADMWLVCANTDDGELVTVMELADSGKWIYEGEFTFQKPFYVEVTHWMPLPSPPKQ